MKKQSILAVLTAAFLLIVFSPSKAQEPFLSNSNSFRFDPLRHSNYFIKDGQVQINIYGETKATSGKFKIPTSIMYRYVYTDTSSVIGQMEPLMMSRQSDFDYVSQICIKAKLDTRANYKMWKASTFGTLFLTIASPVASLGLAVPASLTPPRIENLGLSDVDMLQEGIYFHTYRQEAQRLKNKRIWTAYGIGLGIHVGIIFGLISAFQ